MAYSMVTIYGMNDKVGNVSFNDSTGEYTYSKPYSEKTSEMIDEEVRKIIDNAFQRTKELLLSKKKELIHLAQELLKKEILFQYDLEALIGKRPFEHKTNYENYMESDNTKKDEAPLSELTAEPSKNETVPEKPSDAGENKPATDEQDMGV
jgi:AFG3 family protein